MEEMLYLALHDGIAKMAATGEILQQTHTDGAAALCAGQGHVFCADGGGAIWRMDADTLMPRALGCGGPGVCAMCLSPCGERVYALLGEADSVLMSEAKSCRPLAVNRCGVNPKSLACCGDSLIAAGGESCRVHIYSARTLDCVSEIAMPGPVCSAACADGAVYALCLAQDMHALLVRAQGERRITLRLDGMPGCLLVTAGCVLAATYGWLYIFSPEGLRLLGKRKASGRTGRIIALEDRIILHDPLSECVFSAQGMGAWRRLAGGVCDICDP